MEDDSARNLATFLLSWCSESGLKPTRSLSLVTADNMDTMHDFTTSNLTDVQNELKLGAPKKREKEKIQIQQMLKR